MNLLDNFETLQERINARKDIEETVEEFVDAVNEATDEGYIEYDSKDDFMKCINIQEITEQEKETLLKLFKSYGRLQLQFGFFPDDIGEYDDEEDYDEDDEEDSDEDDE